MNRELLLCAFCWLYSNLSFGFYVHLYGPNYTCQNSQQSFFYEDDYGGGIVEVSVVRGEIFNEVTQTWVTYWSFYEGDYSYGNQNTPFKIRWNNSVNGSVGSIHIRVCDATLTFICSNGNKNVVFGSSPGTPTIGGSGQILNCYDQQQLYTASSFPEGWQLTGWTLSSNLSQISSGVNSITVKAASTSFNGPATITGNLAFSTGGNTCDTRTVTKSIWLGKPAPVNQVVDGMSYSHGFLICPGNHWVGISWNGQISSTNWSVTPGIAYFANNTQCDFTLPINGYNSVVITVSATNSCGTSANANYFLQKKTFGCGSYRVATYPNPASDEINIESEFETLEGLRSFVVPDQITFLNKQGIKLFSLSPSKTNEKIDVRAIPNGEYLLKIRFGREEFVSRLLIKR